MIARVTLELALRKEFDYLIPPQLAGQVDVGSRVQVPLGVRKVMGCVTAVAETSAQPKLKPILKVVGAQTLVTPMVLKLARWIADYYCCPPEIALKSVLPEAVRREESGWRERLFVRALPFTGPLPKLPRRQQAVWNLIEERREMPLQELLLAAETTAATVRRLEDKGLISISPQISERDPYAREHILPTQPLPLNPAQETALRRICSAMDAARAEAGKPKPGTAGVGAADASLRPPPSTFLLHGVTGSGKTEVYLQAIAHALQQGSGAIVLVPEISLTPQTVERFKARFSSGPLRTLVAVLHSHLSAGERHDEWHKIRQGRARIAIGSAGPDHCRRGTRVHLQAGGGAALPRAGRGHHARPDGRRDRRARLGHTLTGELLQLPDGQSHAAGTAGTGGQPPDALCARGGHAANHAPGPGYPDLFPATQGGHRPAAGTRGADHFVPEPARLFEFAALPAVRVRCPLPQLQRHPHLPSPGATAPVPHLRSPGPCAGRLPQ
jgi:hypothetical protein